VLAKACQGQLRGGGCEEVERLVRDGGRGTTHLGRLEGVSGEKLEGRRYEPPTTMKS